METCPYCLRTDTECPAPRGPPRQLSVARDSPLDGEIHAIVQKVCGVHVVVDRLSLQAVLKGVCNRTVSPPPLPPKPDKFSRCVLRQLPIGEYPQYPVLNLIAHSNPTTFQLEFGDWTIGASEAESKAFVLESAEYLEKMSVREIRLLGCNTLCGDAADQTVYFLQGQLDAIGLKDTMVLGSIAVLGAPNYKAWGYTGGFLQGRHRKEPEKCRIPKASISSSLGPYWQRGRISLRDPLLLTKPPTLPSLTERKLAARDQVAAIEATLDLSRPASLPGLQSRPVVSIYLPAQQPATQARMYHRLDVLFDYWYLRFYTQSYPTGVFVPITKRDDLIALVNGLSPLP